MSHAGETLHYQLPQYEGTDIINPLVDTNGAYSKIDETMYSIAGSAAQAIQTAEEVKQDIEGTGGVDSRISALVTRMDAVETKNVEQDTSILGVQQAIQTTNGNVATNTQNITDLSSTVQGHTTSIQNLGTRVQGCENADAALDLRVTALEQGGGSTPTAENVSYDNTTSGMTADNVQDAIDELHNANGIKYNNSSSGLNATTVQGAIDEIANHGSGTADITITGDGIKTVGQCLTELADAIDFSKITPQSVLVQTRTLGTSAAPIIEKEIFPSLNVTEDGFTGANVHGTTNGARIYSIYAGKTGGTTSNAVRTTFVIGTTTVAVINQSTIVVADGDTLEFYY